MCPPHVPQLKKQRSVPKGESKAAVLDGWRVYLLISNMAPMPGEIWESDVWIYAGS